MIYENKEWIARYIPKSINDPILIHNISNPFGICHGIPNETDFMNTYHIFWNRKDLAWSFVEPFNGTFIFNGQTVEDEPYTKGDLNDNVIKIRHYKLNLDEESSQLKENNTIFAFLDNDTERTMNLFDSVINNTSFNITMPIPENRTLLVTYNRSFYLESVDIDKWFSDNKTYKINYLPILDYSNQYLYDLFEEEYKSAGFTSGSVGTYICPSGIWNWLRFVNRTVTRYKDYIDNWEIWNEANNLYRGVENWKYFLLNIILNTAKIIREIDPSSKIYIGGLGGTDELDFLKHIFLVLLNNSEHSEYRNYFDGIAFHPYSSKIPEILINKLEDYSKILNNYSWTKSNEKEMIITEIGVRTNGNGAGGYDGKIFNHQAENVVKSLVIGADVGIPIIIWYAYRDSISCMNENPLDGECYFGLFHSDLSPKPGALAYNLTSYLLANSIAKRGALRYKCSFYLYEPLKHIYGYNFRKEDGTEIIILWNNYKTNLKGKIVFNTNLNSSVIKYNYLDGSNEILLQPDSERKELSFEFGYEPLIISFIPKESIDLIYIEISGNFFILLSYFILPITLISISIISLIQILMSILKYFKIKTKIIKELPKNEK